MYSKVGMLPSEKKRLLKALEKWDPASVFEGARGPLVWESAARSRLVRTAVL